MPKLTNPKIVATLHLTVTFETSLTDVLDAAREIVEKAREQGRPTGSLEIHKTDNIDIRDL